MKALLVGVAAESEAVITHALGNYGHDQSVASEGARALDLVRIGSPALIVVQSPLADMTGVDFCRQARACPEGKDAIILIIVARAEELQACLDAGATDLHLVSLGSPALEIRLHIAKRLAADHAKMRDRELRFRRLFESGVAGITISDLDGDFKEVNDAFLEMVGYTREDMVAGELKWGSVSPLDRVVADTEDRVRLQAEGFLPLRERDYVRKDGRRVVALEGSALLQGTTEYISYIADVSVKKREVEALRANVAQYRALFELSPLPKFLYDRETLRVLAVNDAAIRNYGYSHDDFLRMSFDKLRKTEKEKSLGLAGTDGPGTPESGPWKHEKKDGSVIDVEVRVQEFPLGERPCSLAVAVDVTERNRMESQLRQSQKLDAIGSLAGGIAHDFNNMLSVILSYADMFRADLELGVPKVGDLDEIVMAARRAADLTGQLLVFSRQQILQPKVLDLNAIVDSLTRMLRRLVGEDLELNVVNGAGLGLVKADAGQVEQVLMNLVVNARDAMPKGGTLTIETANVEVDAASASAHAGLRPGSYVMLAVTDTGSGMSAATRERIFEPFFTTKVTGKGTGLGLSTVFGIVQQSGGGLKVDSELDKGTKFTVYLPRARASPLVKMGAAAEARASEGTETILLVEDENSVRTVIRKVLERKGYSILEARSADEALTLSAHHDGRIDVLLTDVVMPRMSGRELAEQLRPRRPEMKIIYMSGYTDDSTIRHGVLHSSVSFLQKPIVPATLILKLREVIDSPVSSWRDEPLTGRSDAPSVASGERQTAPEATSGTFGVVGATQTGRSGLRRGV
jgi:two-component system, cell cycle sensor histidine kinase and response regulator CckA